MAAGAEEEAGEVTVEACKSRAPVRQGCSFDLDQGLLPLSSPYAPTSARQTVDRAPSLNRRDVSGRTCANPE